jgi:hypothetical protein
MRLTTHLHLMLKLRMCGVIPPVGTLTCGIQTNDFYFPHSFVSLQLFLKHHYLNYLLTITYYKTLWYSV